MLEGKVALVTGGSRGIGSEIAKLLASRGATVVINFSFNKAKAEEVAQFIHDSGAPEPSCEGFDVGNEEQVEAAYSSILERHGRLDILVNNAGVTGDNLLLRMKLEEWERVIRTNLTGTFLCAKAAIKPMMKSRYGRIVNISSVIGEMGNAGQASYAASKAGVFGFTKSLAKEVGSRGITVNAVTPGFIKTDMTSEMTEEQVKGLLASIPLNTLGEASDVAELVAFLASPVSGYITGQVIGVNGGLYM
jgi:3-oxoacyl-[acyl-carrier protein] reductase